MTQASSDPQRYRPAAWWMGLLTILLMLLSTMARAESGALARLRADYVQTPIYFEPNLGQSADPVKFLARGPGYALFLTADEAVLALHPARSGNEPAAVIRTRLEGATRHPEPRIEGLEKLPGISNYLLGKDRAQWRTQVPHYRRVRYAEVYPGIDLVYYGNPQQLEHDFIVAPGADPAQIQLAISGAERVRVNPEGDLILTVPGGEVVQQAPRIYQVINGQQQTVAGRYVLRNSEAAATTVNIAVADPMLEPLRVGFEIAHYDPKQPLVIDPVLNLVYSTFLGGIKEDYGTSIAVDHNGYAYVTGGTTSSLDFPTAGGGLGTNPPPAYTKQDAFVSKFDFNESGVNSLLCSTYLGGSSDDKDDIGYAIAVDDMGFAYVTGTTASESFPTLPPGTFNGGKDAFMVILDTNCGLLFSTYWGGTKDDEGRGIAVRSQWIYVTGYTNSNFTDLFPLKNSFQPALLGGTDVFVSVIDASGTLRYSTYLGGAKDDKGAAVAVDDSGAIYLTGSTASANFPVTGLAFDTTLGGSLDSFIAKIDPFSFPSPNGRYSLLYSSYLGGSGADSGAGIAVDSRRHAYVTGSTASTNFPMTPNAAQNNYAGNGDVFVAKIDPDPTLVGINSLLYSTYLGGSGADSGAGIVVIESADAIRTYVTGATASANFPVTSDAMDATLGGSGDVFVAQLSDTGKLWLYATYLGGDNGIDSGAGIAADVSATGSNIYITGATSANDFTCTTNAFYCINSAKDVFVVKLEDSSFSMSVNRVGSGTVTSSPSGILCGADCTEIYTAGASITLTATPAVGYQFTGWNGGGCSGAGVCTVTMNASKSITATFAPVTYALTVSKVGTGGGTVSGGGNYAAGAMANLTATPNAGSIFAGWSPSPCATSFAMPASNLTCTATFNTTPPNPNSSFVGVFRDGVAYLDANGNGGWDGCGTELCTGFGQAGDLPVSGNWDGGGKSYIGVFRPATGEWFMDHNGNGVWDGCSTDSCYSGFGQGGDQSVAGDWNGDSKAKVGVFRNGQWLLDSNGNGAWDGCGTDLCLSFGQANDLPVAGKWNGGLKAGVGVFRVGTWYLDYNGNGQWDGCQQDGGQDKCLYNSFGQSGDLPVAGDWNGDGKAKVGVFRAGAWYLDHNGNGEWDGCSVDRCYFGGFGQAGDWPVAGKWQ